MTMNLSPVLKQTFFDSNGDPLAGGKLYTYQAGTSTPQATYTSASGGANANPVILDSNGQANVWADPSLSYKYVLKNSSDVEQWTVDNVAGLLNANSVATASIQDLAVTAAKLADDAVTADKLRDDGSIDANRAVTTNHVRDAAITAAKLATDSVITAKILDLNVTTGKINDLAVTTGKINDGAVTAAKRASLTKTLSSSCGNFTNTSTTYTDVTNLSCTITTSGRPVMICLVADNLTNSNVKAVTEQCYFKIVRTLSGTPTDQGIFAFGPATLPGSVIQNYDAPAAGTYTYKLQAKTDTGAGDAQVNNSKLLVYEL